MTRTLRTRLAALAAVGGLVTTAGAQPPADPPANPVPVAPAPDQPAPARVAPVQPVMPQPQVIRWPGGSVTLNGPEVIVRQNGSATGRSTNVVSGSGNGVGNTIVVDNGPGGGVTVVQGARNGIGNRVVVGPDDLLLDLDLPGWVVPPVRATPAPADPAVAPAPVPVAPATPIYKGKANPFWAQKAWSEAHDCNLYWSPADKAWFRYHSEDDTYRPATGPVPPVPAANPAPPAPAVPGAP